MKTLFHPGQHFALSPSNSKQLPSLWYTSRLQFAHKCKPGLAFFLSIFFGATIAGVHLGGEGCHCCHLVGDRSCKVFHHCFYFTYFLVGACSQRTCRILGRVGEDCLAIHAGLKIYDALSLYVGLVFEIRSVVHWFCEAAICCCVSCPPWGISRLWRRGASRKIALIS